MGYLVHDIFLDHGWYKDSTRHLWGGLQPSTYLQSHPDPDASVTIAVLDLHTPLVQKMRAEKPNWTLYVPVSYRRLNRQPR